MSLKLLSLSAQADGTVSCPGLSLLLFKICSMILWRGITQEVLNRQYMHDSFSKGRPSKRQGTKRCARCTLRERAWHCRKELFKASRATCAQCTPLVAFDSHSSCGCSSDVAAGAVDVLELPSRAPCWLLGMGARSSPGAHLLQGDPGFNTKCLELFPVR